MAALIEMNLCGLPNEILENVFILCSIEDLKHLKSTCKRFTDIISSDHFWQMKWPHLVKSSNLNIIRTPTCKSSQDNYYACSQRLLKVAYRQSLGFSSLPTCPKCLLTSVCNSCLQDGNTRWVSLDIGSKTTWLVTPHGNIQRHPTVLVVPSNENGIPITVTCLLCNRKQRDMSKVKPGFLVQPPSYFNHSVTTVQTSCHENDHYNKSKSTVKYKKTLEFPKPLPFSDLWLELPYLYMLHTANLKFSIYQPTYCFAQPDNIDCLKSYIQHVMSKFFMLEAVRKPNSSFLFCEPFNCSQTLRRKLCIFFFETLQVSRLCFISKGLAVSYLLGLSDCLVIDSGASNTLVYVILNEQLQTQRTQHCPIGGLNIAKDLYVALQFSGIKKKVYGPSLDSSRLKRSCYLALNPALEQRKASSSKQKVFVRFLNRTVPSCEVDVLQMGAELFLAPEIHYTAQNLPRRIQVALEKLPLPTVQLLLSNIVLTGSNTELRGFTTRLTSDLQKAFPQSRNCIHLCTHRGGHSWDAAIGAMNAPSHEKTIGSVFWVDREDYILNEPSLFSEET